MAQTVFDKIITQGIRAGQVPARHDASREWFRKTAKNVNVSPSKLFKENKDRMTTASAIEIGQMYMFNYDPKHKKTLPYYDTFPLIFPIDMAEKGFYGLNLHYLPLRERAVLMDALYKLVSDNRYDERTKLRLSYQVLNATAKYKAFRPTLKRYLFSQVKSRMMKIESVEWDIALFLPTQRFQKASTSKVYKDSRSKI